VKLITAHRILIGAGIAFFAFYAARRAWEWSTTSSGAALIHAVVSAAITIVLIFYFRSLRTWGRR
jgi:hypothetical protein